MQIKKLEKRWKIEKLKNKWKCLARYDDVLKADFVGSVDVPPQHLLLFDLHDAGGVRIHRERRERQLSRHAGVRKAPRHHKVPEM